MANQHHRPSDLHYWREATHTSIHTWMPTGRESVVAKLITSRSRAPRAMRVLCTCLHTCVVYVRSRSTREVLRCDHTTSTWTDAYTHPTYKLGFASCVRECIVRLRSSLYGIWIPQVGRDPWEAKELHAGAGEFDYLGTQVGTCMIRLAPMRWQEGGRGQGKT